MVYSLCMEANRTAKLSDTGHIPGFIIMCIAGILEKMVKEYWQNTFVLCMYKFESMQMIYYIGFTLKISKVFPFIITPSDICFSIALLVSNKNQ